MESADEQHRFDDIALVLEHVPLRRELAERLRRSPVELEVTDEQLAELNDACIGYVQEHGSISDVARRLELVVDTLNES